MILRMPRPPWKEKNHEVMLRSRRRGVGQVWMVLRRPQLPRKEETHDVIGQVLVILRRPRLLRKKKTHDVMLRSRRLGIGQVRRAGSPTEEEKGKSQRHAAIQEGPSFHTF